MPSHPEYQIAREVLEHIKSSCHPLNLLEMYDFPEEESYITALGNVISEGLGKELCTNYPKLSPKQQQIIVANISSDIQKREYEIGRWQTWGPKDYHLYQRIPNVVCKLGKQQVLWAWLPKDFSDVNCLKEYTSQSLKEMKQQIDEEKPVKAITPDLQKYPLKEFEFTPYTDGEMVALKAKAEAEMKTEAKTTVSDSSSHLFSIKEPKIAKQTIALLEKKLALHFGDENQSKFTFEPEYKATLIKNLDECIKKYFEETDEQLCQKLSNALINRFCAQIAEDFSSKLLQNKESEVSLKQSFNNYSMELPKCTQSTMLSYFEPTLQELKEAWGHGLDGSVTLLDKFQT